MNSLKSKNRKEKVQSGLISAFLTFTIFVFGPIEAYINNQDEFWFGLNSLVGLIVGGATICYLLFYLVLLLVDDKYSYYLKAITLGLAFALYIQGNFMLVKYGVFDGRNIEWDGYGNWGIYNTAIWILCIIAPIIMVRKSTKWFYTFSCGLSAFITAIQVVTIMTLVFSVGLGSKDQIIVTTEGAFDVSSNKNIAVFIVDTMDAQYFQDVMEEYPEVKGTFADFTYYENTMGLYPTTKAALPQILTGNKYLNEVPYNEYIKDAWGKSPLVKELDNNNFSYGIYTLTPFISDQTNLINLEKGKPIVKSHWQLYKEYAKLVLFKYTPHVFKKFFIIDADNFDANKASRKKTNSYNLDTKLLHELLEKKGVKVTPQNTFRAYHYTGSHPPYTLDENLNEVGEGETSYTKQTRGALKVVEDYINFLKEKNCYENSMIVVMADHGGENLKQHPALLIKYPQHNHAFHISDASISYADLMATFISGITDNYQQYGESIADIDNQENRGRKREYLFYDWDDSWSKKYLPDMKQYITSKHVDELSEEDITTSIYTLNGKITREPVKYNWEQEFSFTDEDDRKSVLEGISIVENNYSWSLGKKTVIQIDLIDQPKNDILLALNIPFILGDEQRIRIYINSEFIDEKELMVGNNDLKIIIPQKSLFAGINNIRFEYPDAKSPRKMFDSADGRILAVALSNLKLSEANVEKYRLKIDNQFDIDFSEDLDSDLLFLDKWHRKEESGIWTTEESTITFYTDKEVEMEVSYSRFQENVETQVLLNGDIIGSLNNDQVGTYKIILPKDKLKPYGKQMITFKTPNAKTPQELGINGDVRRLGIFVTKISFKVQ